MLASEFELNNFTFDFGKLNVFVGLKKLFFVSDVGGYSGDVGGLKLGDRQDTNEFFREGELFLEALLLRDTQGEIEFDGLIDDPL